MKMAGMHIIATSVHELCGRVVMKIEFMVGMAINPGFLNVHVSFFIRRLANNSKLVLIV